MPPGYLGFNSPSALSVRHHGVKRFLPSAWASAAAWAAIHAKIPVVMGQATSTPCLRASAARSWPMVVNLPLVTCRIKASTSIGAGTTSVPWPHLLLILPVMRPTLGNRLLSANFSRQVLRRADLAFTMEFGDFIFRRLQRRK